MVYGIEANILGLGLSAAKNDNSKLACIGTRELSPQAIYQRTHRPSHRVCGAFLYEAHGDLRMFHILEAGEILGSGRDGTRAGLPNPVDLPALVG